MQTQFIKNWLGWIVGLVAVSALLAVLLVNSTAIEKKTTEPLPEDSSGLSVSFDPKEGLVFLDEQGNRIKPVELDPKNPIRDLFKSGELTDISGIPATIFSFKRNPNCNPTFIFGHFCAAPHPSCCASRN
jgi:hypothetical protein